MKLLTIAAFVLLTLQGCDMNQEKDKSTVAENPMIGTWELVTGTTIQGKDTTTTDYTKGKKFLKVINSTHFSFVGHDLSKGKPGHTSRTSSRTRSSWRWPSGLLPRGNRYRAPLRTGRQLGGALVSPRAQSGHSRSGRRPIGASARQVSTARTHHKADRTARARARWDLNTGSAIPALKAKPTTMPPTPST